MFLAQLGARRPPPAFRVREEPSCSKSTKMKLCADQPFQLARWDLPHQEPPVWLATQAGYESALNDFFRGCSLLRRETKIVSLTLSSHLVTPPVTSDADG